MKRGEVITGSKTAIVTGAARGLGRAYAFELASLGYNMVLVGRGINVEAVKRSINERFPDINVQNIIVDLATQDAANQLFNTIKERCLEIDVLVNNAGMFSFCDITETKQSVVERMLFLHNMTLTKLNRLFAQDMATRGGGHILNMSSYSIWMPFPGISLYAASKSFVRSFTIAFSKEVRSENIYVTAICPAGIATDLYGLSPRFQKLGLKTGVLMSPERCAHLSLRALWKHRRSAIPDWWNALFIPILMHLPTFVENIIRKKTMKYQR